MPASLRLLDRLREVERAGIDRLACDRAVDAELFQRGNVLERGDAARGDNLAGDRRAKRRELVEVRACEHAVLVDVGENDVFHPVGLHALSERDVIFAAVVQPAVRADSLALGINADNDLVAVLFDRLRDKFRVADRRRADDDARNAEREHRLDVLHRADAAAKLCTPEEIVITADTMVFLDDQRLGKPQDEADALRMLTALQGRRHTVCTGVTVRQGDRVLTESEATGVVFRPAEESELRAYIATGEPMDKAGSYGVQGKGALLVERLEGDFFNVMGLPVLRLSRMLAQFGIKLL